MRTLSPVLIFILKHFRGKRYDLRIPEGTQFTCDRPKDASSLWILRILINDHARILVETNVCSVLSTRFLTDTNENDRYPVAFFDGGMRHGFLDDRSYEITDSCGALLISAEYANHLKLFCPTIVRDFQHCAMLDHIKRSSSQSSTACHGRSA